MNSILGYMIKRYTQSEKRIYVDFVLFLLFAFTTYLLLRHYNVESVVHSIASLYPSLDIPSLVLTLAICAVVLVIYVVRRQAHLHFQINQANTDALVGVFNRRKGTELLQSEILRANLHRVPLALVMFDIDNFKQINDKFGHDKGDEVLKDVIKLARKHSRNSDVIVRWGGEEFVIGCCSTQLNAAEKLAERIRAAIAEHVFSINTGVTASFGATSYHLCEELDDTLKRVDELLYRSKRSGKNQVQCELDLDDHDIALQ